MQSQNIILVSIISIISIALLTLGICILFILYRRRKRCNNTNTENELQEKGKDIATLNQVTISAYNKHSNTQDVSSNNQIKAIRDVKLKYNGKKELCTQCANYASMHTMISKQLDKQLLNVYNYRGVNKIFTTEGDDNGKISAGLLHLDCLVYVMIPKDHIIEKVNKVYVTEYNKVVIKNNVQCFTVLLQKLVQEVQELSDTERHNSYFMENLLILYYNIENIRSHIHKKSVLSDISLPNIKEVLLSFMPKGEEHPIKNIKGDYLKYMFSHLYEGLFSSKISIERFVTWNCLCKLMKDKDFPQEYSRYIYLYYPYQYKMKECVLDDAHLLFLQNVMMPAISPHDAIAEFEVEMLVKKRGCSYIGALFLTIQQCLQLSYVKEYNHITRDFFPSFICVMHSMNYLTSIIQEMNTFVEICNVLNMFVEFTELLGDEGKNTSFSTYFKNIYNSQKFQKGLENLFLNSTETKKINQYIQKELVLHAIHQYLIDTLVSVSQEDRGNILYDIIFTSCCVIECDIDNYKKSGYQRCAKNNINLATYTTQYSDYDTREI